MNQPSTKLPGHLLRNERRAFVRTKASTIKTVLMRRIYGPAVILSLCALFLYGVFR